MNPYVKPATLKRVPKNMFSTDCLGGIMQLIRHSFKSGRMAERFIAAVLKTVVLKGTGGSNPSPSATV